MSSPQPSTGPGDPRRRHRNAFRAGLAISALVHLVGFWLIAGVDVPVLPLRLPPLETIPAPEGLVVVEVAESELPEPAPEEPRPEPTPPPVEDVERTPPEDVPTPPEEDEEEDDEGLPGAPGVGDPGAPGLEGPEEGERMSNASRLRLRFSDARIWFDPSSPTLFGERLARFARADSAVRAILAEWLDSLALSEEQRRRATDWTFERDGKRWGISPEGLHLGDITIPIPIGFAPSGPRRREFEQAIRDLTAIQLQDLRQDLEAVADERRRAMRERSAEEIRRRGVDTLRVRPPP